MADDMDPDFVVPARTRRAGAKRGHPSPAQFSPNPPFPQSLDKSLNRRRREGETRRSRRSAVDDGFAYEEEDLDDGEDDDDEEEDVAGGSKREEWSRAEIDALRMAVDRFGTDNSDSWKHVGRFVSEKCGVRRSAKMARAQFNRMIKARRTKGPWTVEEDAHLLALVQESGGPHKLQWSAIAMHMNQRDGKQCRDRWYNHVDPGITRAEWTEEEDDQLFSLQQTLGNKWADIAKRIPGRTENQVKNRYHSKAHVRWVMRQAESRGVSLTEEEAQQQVGTSRRRKRKKGERKKRGGRGGGSVRSSPAPSAGESTSLMEDGEDSRSAMLREPTPEVVEEVDEDARGAGLARCEGAVDVSLRTAAEGWAQLAAGVVASRIRMGGMEDPLDDVPVRYVLRVMDAAVAKTTTESLVVNSTSALSSPALAARAAPAVAVTFASRLLARAHLSLVATAAQVPKAISVPTSARELEAWIDAKADDVLMGIDSVLEIFGEAGIRLPNPSPTPASFPPSRMGFGASRFSGVSSTRPPPPQSTSRQSHHQQSSSSSSSSAAAAAATLPLPHGGTGKAHQSSSSSSSKFRTSPLTTPTNNGPWSFTVPSTKPATKSPKFPPPDLHTTASDIPINFLNPPSLGLSPAESTRRPPLPPSRPPRHHHHHEPSGTTPIVEGVQQMHLSPPSSRPAFIAPQLETAHRFGTETDSLGRTPEGGPVDAPDGLPSVNSTDPWHDDENLF